MRKKQTKPEITYLKAGDLSRKFNVSLTTIYRMIDEGKIPAIKFGKKSIRIDSNWVPPEGWSYGNR